jgi:hypothetical protein
MTDNADGAFLKIEVVVDVAAYCLEVPFEVSRYLVQVGGRPSRSEVFSQGVREVLRAEVV